MEHQMQDTVSTFDFDNGSLLSLLLAETAERCPMQH